MAKLIQDIKIIPENPRPAETVKVEVVINENEENVKVTIDGILGNIQYLQFKNNSKLLVRAIQDDKKEMEIVDVAISGVPVAFKTTKYQRKRVLAMMHTQQSLAEPYKIAFYIGDKESSGLRKSHTFDKYRASKRTVHGVSKLNKFYENKLFRSQRTLEAVYEWDFGDGTNKIFTLVPYVEHDFFSLIDHTKDVETVDIKCRIMNQNISITRTIMIQTAYSVSRQRGVIVPFVKNNIFAEKIMLLNASFFSATMSVINVEKESIVLNKMSITPLAEDDDVLAVPKEFVDMENQIEIAPESVSSVQMLIKMMGDNLIIDKDEIQLKYNISGFTVYYSGTCGDKSVLVTTVFEIPLNMQRKKPSGSFEIPKDQREEFPWNKWDIWNKMKEHIPEIVRSMNGFQPNDVLMDEKTSTFAINLGSKRTMFSDAYNKKQVSANKIFKSMITQVYKEASQTQEEVFLYHTSSAFPHISNNKAKRLKSRVNSKSYKISQKKAVALLKHIERPQPGTIDEGQVCDPDDLTTEQISEGKLKNLACMITDEEILVRMPGRFMNARKGDIVLSPGGSGMIGQLLRVVQPPQYFSHTGIMTKNLKEITHSTASEDRFKDYPEGMLNSALDLINEDPVPTDAFEHNAVKYMWPGVVLQTVENSINGEKFIDPANEKKYIIDGFEPYMLNSIMPVVIKPQPGLENSELRETLHSIAHEARNDAGTSTTNSKSHYRLYCYTDPTIALNSYAPYSAGWANDTYPSVCSSFVWKLFKKRGLHLEGALEYSDVLNGATKEAATTDGLYTYTAHEREVATNFLYNLIYNTAYEEEPLGLLADAPDDIATQMVNLFINDNTDKDTALFTILNNITKADAVSPSDTLWWDSPNEEGYYGYAEPLMYREPREELYTLYKWQFVAYYATISGKVIHDDIPVEGATVETANQISIQTDSNGNYELINVPIPNENRCEIRASKTIDGYFQNGASICQFKTDEVNKSNMDIELFGPDKENRLVKVTWSFEGRDDEVFGNEMEYKDGNFEKALNPEIIYEEFKTLTFKWGGEVRVEYQFNFIYVNDGKIKINIISLLYEGIKETTNDLEKNENYNFTIEVDEMITEYLEIKHPNEDTWGKLTLTIANEVNRV